MGSNQKWGPGLRPIWPAALALALLLSGCSPADSAGDAPFNVIATTTVLGDVAANVMGENGTLAVLLPVGADPHDYQVSAQQVAAILAADLIVSNGLGLEEGLEDILEQAAADGVAVLEVGPQLDPLPRAAAAGAASAEGTLDPHVWLDPLRMAQAAQLIAGALESVAPGELWAERAAAYAAELKAADESIIDLLSGIAPERRTLVTNHDSLGYFAARYGFEIIGSVIPGGSTLANPSSQDLADLVAVMEAARVTAIFAETTEPRDLAEAIAAESSRPVTVHSLYTGSLGEPGSDAATLIEMLLVNARTIADALQ